MDSRLQVGAAGKKLALFPSSAAVQVAVGSPISSKPLSHVYEAVSSFREERPVVDTPPLVGLLGSVHRAN